MNVTTFNQRKKKKAEMTRYIRGACKEKKITQNAVAEKLLISPQAYGKKLRRNQYTYEDLLLIFDMLKPTPEELVELMKL